MRCKRDRAVVQARDHRPMNSGRAGDDAERLRAGRVEAQRLAKGIGHGRSEEHTSELQSLMRNSYAVFCLKKKKNLTQLHTTTTIHKERAKTNNNTEDSENEEHNK